MSLSRRLRIALLVFLVIYLAGGIYTLVHQLMALPFPASVFMDFGFYEDALARVFSGGDMYAVREIGPAFLYPPPALLLVELFNIIPDAILRVAFFGALDLLIAAAIVAGVARHYRLPLADVWYWFPLALGFGPLLVTIEFGQINMLTQLGLALMLFYESSAPFWSGAGLGLAVMTKVTPLFMGAYLLAAKSFKSLLWTIATVLVLVLLGVLRYGVGPFITYWTVFRSMTSMVPVGANGQSLAARLLAVGLPVNIGLVQFSLAFGLVLVVLVDAYLTFRAGWPKDALFIVTMLAMLLSPNILWYHHYVFFLLPLLVWMGWRRDSRFVTGWCLAGMLVIQFDYFLLTGGLLVHVFGLASIVIVLVQGALADRTPTPVDPQLREANS